MSPPHLLYVYPWMPYPRRILIFLREHAIPSSIVTVVPVSDPFNGDKAPDGFPPRPAGSLPILAIPPSDTASTASIPEALEGWKLLKQSLPIIQYISQTMLRDPHADNTDAYISACNTGYEISAETVMVQWNTVRLFGSGAGSIKLPEAAKEGLKWVYRELATIEKHLDPISGTDVAGGGYANRLSPAADKSAKPSTGDILLMSFLELVDDLYCCFDELTLGHGEGKDAYGRAVENVGYYPHIRQLYRLFRERASASRAASVGYSGEVKPELRKRAGEWPEQLFN